MKRSNAFALVVVLAVVIGLPAALFGYRTLWTRAAGVRVIEITARTPQTGGFAPDHIELRAGEPVLLRISSPDVVHGFSIPGLAVNVKEILPGRPVDVKITPQKPGRYAFACTRWCGIDHWRMRGEIEVVSHGADLAAAAPSTEPPLYQRLGQDLDAMRAATGTLPATPPSTVRGAALASPGITLPASLRDSAERRAVAPVDAFRQVEADPAHAQLSDDQVWDLVAWLWTKDTQPEALAAAQQSYAQDCAACHGPDGKGDGPAGQNLPGLSLSETSAPAPSGAHLPPFGRGAGATGAGGEPLQPHGPADFTDQGRMLATSDAVLQGKILRGGMGTGMPEFGSLYSDDQLWALVAYVRGFIFQK